jgi:non-ribosomal peptide synthetase component F
MKPDNLALTCFYVFLFKLTNGEQDMCIGMEIDNHYKHHLHSIIGNFINTILLRCLIDPNDYFIQLLEKVLNLTETTSKQSYFPLQRILARHLITFERSIPDISFSFRSNHSEHPTDLIKIGHVQLTAVSSSANSVVTEIISKYDFAFRMQHDESDGQLLCTIEASLDIFEASTIDDITRRFYILLEQLFDSTLDRLNRPIYELSIILSHEIKFIQSINATGTSVPPSSCIHNQFIQRSSESPQKISVELDDQSLTYSELLYYVQRLAIVLLDMYELKSGEIVCQCVERSIAMVSDDK